MNAKRARKIIITPTVMPHVTPKQKSRNIILHPTQSVVIAVLTSQLPMVVETDKVWSI